MGLRNLSGASVGAMLTSLTVPFLPMRTPKPRWIKPSLRPLYHQQCQIRLFQRATERHQSKNQKLKTQLLWLPQFWKSIAAHWLYPFLKNSPLHFWSRELIFTNTIWQRLKVPSFLTSFVNKKTCCRNSNMFNHTVRTRLELVISSVTGMRPNQN